MFDRWFDATRWSWCALSGLLLIASFAPFSSPTCGWIALVPVWWVLTRSERVRQRPFRHGYFIGLIFFGGVFWWICNVTTIGMVFLVLYLALFPAVWCFLVVRFIPRQVESTHLGILFRALAAAALWVTLEWWRSWYLTGFNWNELGISQAPSIIFRQLAAYGGIHLISFILVTVNILWAEGLLTMAQTLRERKVVRASFPFAAALFIIAFAFALGWHHLQRHRGGEPTRPSLTFACVQPNIPQIVFTGSDKDFWQMEDDALDKTEKLTLQAIATKPDLLVWPEAMIDEGVFQDRQLNEAVHGICETFGGYFLLGSQDFDIGAGRKLYNCAYLFTPRGEQYQEYRKTHLVVLGEFLPLGNQFPWLRRVIGIGMDFTPGPRPERFVMQKPPLTFAPLICFEDTLPDVTDRAARLGPDFFVTITNDGWYQGWCARWGIRQHLSHAVFRCIEHDHPMLRCANTGISCVIDQDGAVTNRFRDASGAETDVGGIFTGTLEFYPHHSTLYEAWGDWIVLISCLLTVMLGIRFFCQSPRNK
ncbi:MAG: apolipoprotein N-acyltransferase [Methylacidiphilales bacterium]|nr:apolipoprotein N-acyltransferase [Candidatus Methylacidiphilales bacterium]